MSELIDYRRKYERLQRTILVLSLILMAAGAGFLAGSVIQTDKPTVTYVELQFSQNPPLQRLNAVVNQTVPDGDGYRVLLNAVILVQTPSGQASMLTTPVTYRVVSDPKLTVNTQVQVMRVEKITSTPNIEGFPLKARVSVEESQVFLILKSNGEKVEAKPL